jgi:hypothetical protein
MPKPVSDEVFQRIALALDTIARDEAARPTKREVERLTSLSHDTVARAFRIDAESPTTWRITERLQQLTTRSGGPSTRRSQLEQRLTEVGDQLDQSKAETRELRRVTENLANILLAQHLELAAARGEADNVVSIGRR